MHNITDTQQFDSLISEGNNRPVLVDFHASWCGPCKMLSPIVQSIAEKYADSLDVVKVDADEFQAITNRYGVLGIPTLLLFKDGVPVATHVGAASMKKVEAFVSDNI